MNTAIAFLLLSLFAVCQIIQVVLSRSQEPYDANGESTIRGDGSSSSMRNPSKGTGSGTGIGIIGQQDTQYFNANNEDWSKDPDTRVRMTFRNDLPVAIDLYYENENADKMPPMEAKGIL